MAPTPRRGLFGRSLTLFAATTVAAGVSPFFFEGGVRAGLAAGAAAAAVASAAALGLLSLAFDRGMKLVLGALVAGFLVRLLLVAAGLLVALSLGGEPLAFCAAFFALYLAHQAIELTVVVRRARPAVPEGQA